MDQVVSYVSRWGGVLSCSRMNVVHTASYCLTSLFSFLAGSPRRDYYFWGVV